jgi:hypothetical protein
MGKGEVRGGRGNVQGRWRGEKREEAKSEVDVI